jgi:hypothetical protein
MAAWQRPYVACVLRHGVGPTGRPAGETGGKLLELLALDMHGYPDDGLLHTLPDRLHTVSGAAMCLVCLKTICVGLFCNGYKYICVFVCLLGVLDMNIKRWRLDILFRLLLNFFLIYGFFTSVHEKLSFSFLFKYKLAGIDSYMCHSIVW